MFKRLRDFIYDINDIFVAIIILAVAASVIYWRSSNIVDYPKYLYEKSHSNTASEIDFSNIDLDPEPVDPNYNQNPEDQGSFVDPDNPPASNTIDTSDVPVPGKDNTADNTGNNSNNENNAGTETDNTANNAENNNAAENDNGNNANNSENTNNGENEPDDVEPDDVIYLYVPFGSSWFAVADELSRLGLIPDTDDARTDFIYAASKLGLDARLNPDTYELHEGMTYDEIIRAICGLD